MNLTNTLIQLIGGLGLFLYGTKLMGEGLENSAGDKLKSILEKVTTNPLSAVAVGAIVTAIIQSSSATTVMVVGFVNAGLMNLFQAAGIIMGANIGTTITAQLVAFKLDGIAPIFVGIGTVIVLFAKGKKRKDLGYIILGFGILFMGMGLMSDAMKPLAETSQFENLVLAVQGNWLLGLLTGLALTAIVQSSSATTAILIALATSGKINLQVAIPILFGCNIGTCITAMLASVGTNKTAHKAAAIHLIFNTVGAFIFIPFIPIISKVAISLSPTDTVRQVANVHTIFNIANTLLMLPLIKYLIKIVNKLIPGEDDIEPIGTKFIDDRLLETPVIAAGQVIKETIRMASKAKVNLEIAMEAFNTSSEKLVEKVYENEKMINFLEEEITNYLVKLSKCELSDKEQSIVSATFYIVNDIERIGDHVENIADLTTQRIAKKITYTEDATKEVMNMYAYTESALQVAIECYESRDVLKADTVTELEQKIDSVQKEYRENHIKRLNQGKCNAYSGAIFMDLLSNFERIGDHANNIAESVSGRNHLFNVQ